MSQIIQPHQQRVIDERHELDTKIAALFVFINESPIFDKLDDAEQVRLKRQLDHMIAYSDILKERIGAF